jgi:hypothetical protein
VRMVVVVVMVARESEGGRRGMSLLYHSTPLEHYKKKASNRDAFCCGRGQKSIYIFYAPQTWHPTSPDPVQSHPIDDIIPTHALSIDRNRSGRSTRGTRAQGHKRKLRAAGGEETLKRGRTAQR